MDPNAFDKAMKARLASHAPLITELGGGTAIYESVAPQGATFPLVIFNVQVASVPVRTLNQVAYENMVYLVKGVTGDPSPARCGTLAKLIETALIAAPLTVDGYGHMLCQREQSVSFHEVIDGVRYYHRGGMYRLQATPN
jgi:hypothetical protein